MRSSPLVLLALVAAGFGLVSVPLARLTGAERVGRGAGEVRVGPSVAGAADDVRAVVRVRYVHEPERVVLSVEGHVVAEFAGPWEAGGGLRELEVAVPIEEGEPLEVLVEARWPTGTPTTALGVEWEPDGFETRRQTVWAGDGEVVEALTFLWP
ncbi:MAG: hypothetical protein ACKV19_11335 [Verrucomicrobiales bacterium]